MSPLPYIPFENCAELVVEGEVAGQANFLTLGVRKSEPFVSGDYTTILNTLQDWLHDELMPLLSSATQINATKLTDLTTISSPTVNLALAPPNVGGGSASAIPANVAAVVTFYTALRGRSYRGRNYVFGFPLSDLQDQDTLTTTFQANLTSAYQVWGTSIGGAGFTHVILSRFNAGVRRDTGVATQVASYVAQPTIGTQRRRVTGHGI